MNPANGVYHVQDLAGLKKKMLNWAARFSIFCFLDNQDYSIAPHRYESLLAAGAKQSISSVDLKDVDRFLKKKQDQWLFGHMSYDLKNTGTGSAKADRVPFPGFFFFVPEFLLKIEGERLTIYGEDADAVYAGIMREPVTEAAAPDIQVRQALGREQYLQKINQLRQHILRGDCYEINFCQEFFAEQADIDPAAVFDQLTRLSPNPFSALYKLHGQYLICASPERFLTRRGNKIYSQPMKGTIKRNPDSREEDDQLKSELQQSAKDQSENVMVVDMVRNDLSRICEPASVKVEELFGVYTYPQVHQMISTISGELSAGIGFSEIMDACFPMGSMTGAPKHRVMELIEAYESFARGIFSGSVGYVDPEGNFDFNVVIRSIMYNSITKYLSYKVGSGITFYSDPEKEWEECLLKGAAIKKVLTAPAST
jgi:para-aminobenzoate synthetase component 1